MQNNLNYGYRRIQTMLKRIGLIVNKKKFQRLIQMENFFGILKQEIYYGKHLGLLTSLKTV